MEDTAERRGAKWLGGEQASGWRRLRAVGVIIRHRGTQLGKAINKNVPQNNAIVPDRDDKGGGRKGQK